MSNEQKSELGLRLAFREEGPYVNAYVALNNTMEKAILIGRIIAPPCKADRSLFEGFKDLMQRTFAEQLKEMAVDTSGIEFEQRPPNS